MVRNFIPEKLYTISFMCSAPWFHPDVVFCEFCGFQALDMKSAPCLKHRAFEQIKGMEDPGLKMRSDFYSCLVFRITHCLEPLSFCIPWLSFK